MTDRATVSEVSQIGVEALGAPGVAVPTNVRLGAMSLNLAPAAELDLFGPDGQKYDTLSTLNKEWSALDVGGRPTYTEIVYPLSGILGDPVITTPGGATLARRWLWSPKPSLPDSLRTFTVAKGVPGGANAERAAFGLLTSFGVTFSRNGGTEMRGSGIAQTSTLDVPLDTNERQTVTVTGAPAGGTFTLTFAGQTTAPIAFDANAAAVAAALEALSNVDDVNVTGGPLPGTPVVVEFRGINAQADVAQMTADDALLTGGSSPEVAVTTTTPGVAPTDHPLKPIAPGQVDLYADDTAGAIGTTQLLRGFIYAFDIGDRLNPIYALNSALASFDGYVETKPNPTVDLTVGNDAKGREFLAAMRSGATKFVRLEATGEPIESGQNYRLRIDAALKVRDAPGRDEVDGLSVLTWGMRVVYDGSFGKALEVELITTLTGL
jgi:hypothetical protein